MMMVKFNCFYVRVACLLPPPPQRVCVCECVEWVSIIHSNADGTASASAALLFHSCSVMLKEFSSLGHKKLLIEQPAGVMMKSLIEMLMFTSSSANVCILCD
jgi:hypothetical protein